MKENQIPATILEKVNYPDKAELSTDSLNEKLKKAAKENKAKIIVLDDDPTGVQTVHDISVFTSWDVESIRQGFEEKNKCFYILTNSRALTADESRKQHEEIIEGVLKVSDSTGIPFILISRSDSTLRGHYPMETEILKKGMEEGGKKIDGEILCFYFREGGRYTIEDVHYVLQGDELVPAALTEFAKDKTFGYKSSNLKEYVEEKTEGKYKASSVVSISLDELNSCDPESIRKKLDSVKDFNKVLVNATCPDHLKVFCLDLYQSLKDGKSFLFRSAAGLVKEMAAIDDKPLLTANDMMGGNEKESGQGKDDKKVGLVLVGSYTKKTGLQLNELLQTDISAIHFHSSLVLDEGAFEGEIKRVISEMNRNLRGGKSTVVYTDREPLKVDSQDKEELLLKSVKISDALCKIAESVELRPDFVIAKGGITSSMIGTEALKSKRATVLGQVYPGIPVWKLGPESKFPNMPYVIFPGNVGGPEALKEVYKKF